MERVGSSSAEIFHQATQKIRYLLESLRPGSATLESMPHQLDELSSELARMGEWLNSHRDSAAASDLKNESKEYVTLLRKLQITLPELQSRLLVERARLGRDHAHLKAAENWINSSRETL